MYLNMSAGDLLKLTQSGHINQNDLASHHGEVVPGGGQKYFQPSLNDGDF